VSDYLPQRQESAMPTTAAASKLARSPHAVPAAALSDLRGGLVTWLGSIYIVVLIPAILGMDASGAPIASVSSTALACAAGTIVFAMVTGLPFAIGPGIVPASIVATFLASGIPFNLKTAATRAR
jgi:xanthine/uracil/vitamin C permease (AzgA family)